MEIMAMAAAQGVNHGEEWGFNWNFLRYVPVNTDLDPLSYLLNSIGGIMLKDIKPRHIPKMIPQTIPVCLVVLYE